MQEIPEFTARLDGQTYRTRKNTSQEADFFDICGVSNEQNLVV